ncbi:hypothetical protein EG329_004099 [Mollisiaceae sp. DMI_Dod_QoI]|nr:hypothetical protein EG329_004099 [Helotiales sp. DMI_Dod_QoI]
MGSTPLGSTYLAQTGHVLQPQRIIDDVKTVEPILSSPYDSFPYPEQAVIESHQIEYCVFELKRSVASLVLEGRAPFIHSDLYLDTLPDTYQDLIGICSLYNQKTIHNSVIVFRMLFVKLRKLISASKSITRVEDWLLAVQALLMYQIIRAFDGDSMQRSNAEQDFGLLEDWTSHLQKGYFDAGLSATGTLHQQWLLLESIRRTLMISVLFRSLYGAMKEGTCDLVPLMSDLPVSENLVGWDRVEMLEPTGEQPLVTYSDFVNDWNMGKVTTVDAYEMLLLKACRHAITTV